MNATAADYRLSDPRFLQSARLLRAANDPEGLLRAWAEALRITRQDAAEDLLWAAEYLKRMRVERDRLRQKR